MSNKRRAEGKKGRKELRLSRAERLIVIGWALALFAALYLITPKNAQRAVEHARGHAARRASDTAGTRHEPHEAHKD